jgi:hypothetical protein
MGHVRDSDIAALDGGGSRPLVKITRDVPLWAILSVLGTLALGGGSTALGIINGIADLKREQTAAAVKAQELQKAVESVGITLNANAVQSAIVATNLENLGRRVNGVEQTLSQQKGR